MTSAAAAQELEPRRWSHVPIDTSYFGMAYAYTRGDIYLDPVLRIEDGEARVHTLVTSFLHAFDLAGKTARFDVLLPYQKARWEGLLDGVPAHTERGGLADPRLRLSVNFYGSPALKGEAYRRYRAAQSSHTIAGAALSVTLPLGEYQEDKLLNLGENRFRIRPQLGIVHSRGPWSFELSGSVIFFTDNDAFWNGNTREQEPLYVTQAHVVRTFKRGIWASLSVGHDAGGRSRINGEKKDDSRSDVLYALSAGIPISRISAMKIAYARGRTREEVGSDTDNLVVGYTRSF